MTPDTCLMRQIHPSWIQAGRVTSQAFRPTPKDEHCLSVYDGDQISPQAAYQHFTADLALTSVGVMSVTVAECTELELSVKADPEPYPEHVLIDFSAFSKKQTETKAKLLKAKAERRGWLHQENLA